MAVALKFPKWLFLQIDGPFCESSHTKAHYAGSVFGPLIFGNSQIVPTVARQGALRTWNFVPHKAWPGPREFQRLPTADCRNPHGAEYGLNKEYTSNKMGIPDIVEGVFLNYSQRLMEPLAKKTCFVVFEQLTKMKNHIQERSSTADDRNPAA